MNAQTRNPILKPAQANLPNDGICIAAIYANGELASYLLLQDAIEQADTNGLQSVVAFENGQPSQVFPASEIVTFQAALAAELELLEGARL